MNETDPHAQDEIDRWNEKQPAPSGTVEDVVVLDLKDLVELSLRQKGFDGLWNDYGCACKLGDLMPCGEPSPACEAGYLGPCDGSCEGGKCDFHIGPKHNMKAEADR